MKTLLQWIGVVLLGMIANVIISVAYPVPANPPFATKIQYEHLSAKKILYLFREK